MDYQFELDRLSPLLKEIGRQVLALRRTEDGLHIAAKRDFTDIVTVADTLSERMLVEHITKHHPDHRLRGEEGSRGAASSTFEWIIDPIDGTIVFASGMDTFSISVGLLQDGVPRMGVMYFPAQEKLVTAVRGHGVFVNGVVSPRAARTGALSESLVVFDSAKGDRREDDFERYLVPLSRASRYVLMSASYTGTVLLMIEGKIPLYVHPNASAYDTAAAALAAEEAGCVVGGFTDDPIDFSQERFPIIIARSEGLLQEAQRILD